MLQCNSCKKSKPESEFSPNGRGRLDSYCKTCRNEQQKARQEKRREIGIASGTAFYEWLRRKNYPGGFQVLCHNCNAAKGHLGYCPHKKKIDFFNLQEQIDGGITYAQSEERGRLGRQQAGAS